ncbi:uncharacterized protein LOC143487918 [Brachyhypopomus gauderio]|uniref:uncharacterized protein LOC143487918 n=1 Tax=Brachyhypopomus gauderio TaxID=698409 RepID=UPI00404392F2
MSDSISVINLPCWESGKMRIRFLYLAGNNSFKVSGQSSNEEQLIPLFLGADLFTYTDVRTENHPRYHAKLAKKGLATKLIFSSDFRFQGLRVPSSSNSLWFYCIHGVFRVAFELYSKHDQLSILESFQELWKSRINDESLNMSYNLDIQLDMPKDSDHAVPSSIPNDISPSTNAHSKCQEIQEQFVTFQPLHGLSDDSLSADHNYCSTSEQEESRWPNILTERLCRIAGKVKFITAVEENQRTAVLKLLDFTENQIGGQLDEEGLTETVMTLLQTHSPGFSVYSSPLLQALGAWLGQQFHAANGSVSHQVEGFKMQHIEHIKDLPPAEELAAELFPEAMRNLLIHWMGLSEEAATWKRLSEFPIVLLILEFANHNLITGVAHVLYSSLICR